MLTYATEPYADCEHDIDRLLPSHWREVEMDQDDVPLDFDKELYHTLDSLGRLHVTSVRDDGDLVGYLVAIVHDAPHHKSTLHAVVDYLYLRPEYRKGLNGTRLFIEAEKAFAARGVVKVYAGCKSTKDLTSLYHRLGYQHAETYFSRVISKVTD